jgi:hypothetical protein
MCVSLRDVLTTKETRVETINTTNKGGTYICIICHKVQIPASLKRSWGCVWHKISDVYNNMIGYDHFSDEEIYEKNDSQRKVEMIFKENIDTFFRSVLKSQSEEQDLRYDITRHKVCAYRKFTCGKAVFIDYTNPVAVKSIEKAREVLVHALLTVESYHPILRANRALLAKCLYSDDYLVKKTAAHFRLRNFYMERIRNVIELNKIDFEKLNLTPGHLADTALDSFSLSEQTMNNWRALAERFEYP